MDMLWFTFIFGSNFTFLCCRLVILHYHTQPQRKKLIAFEPGIKFLGGGGSSHIKMMGMVVVLPRGADHTFWTHLGCSG